VTSQITTSVQCSFSFSNTKTVTTALKANQNTQPICQILLQVISSVSKTNKFHKKHFFDYVTYIIEVYNTVFKQNLQSGFPRMFQSVSERMEK